MSGEIRVGHVLTELAAMEAGSVQTCITSPPYFSLRNYSTEPQVWGGEPETEVCPECKGEPRDRGPTGWGCETCWSEGYLLTGHVHEWGEEGRSGQRIRHGQGETTLHETGPHGTQPHGEQQTPKADASVTLHPSTGAFCPCGSWRGELGAEPTVELYVAHLVEVFAAVRRVLRDDGVLFLVLGDSYAGGGRGGHAFQDDVNRRGRAVPPQGEGQSYPRSVVPFGLKPKDLIGVPWRVAFALQADGWWLRSDIVWSKPNPMPESVTDRVTRSHEYVFMLSKAATYFYDSEAIKEACSDDSHGSPNINTGWKQRAIGQPSGATTLGKWTVADKQAGRNRRSVWEIATESYAAAHFATFPEALVTPCILAGTPEAGACSACGAPFERVVERERGGPSTRAAREQAGHRTYEGVTFMGGASPSGKAAGSDTRGLPSITVQTTGHRPTCACNAPARPAVVLDCFGGSGTVGAVAEWLGRSYVLIELNPAYVRLAERRTAQTGMFLGVGSEAGDGGGG